MVRIGIIGAMDEEVAVLIQELKNTEEKVLAGKTFYHGELWGQDTVVVRSGIGKVNMAMCTQQLIDAYEVDILINTGVAGGLNKNVEIGDIVISSDALHHDMDVTGFGYERGVIPEMETSVFVADPELIEMAKAACEMVNTDIGCHVGRILTGDQLISDSETKKFLVENFDGYCVEMEGAAMAQVATLNKKPFVIIRAISDKADEKADQTYDQFLQQAIKHTIKLLVAMFLMMKKK